MNRSRWAVLAFALLLGCAAIGRRPLADPDEGRYAEVAREMLAKHEFLAPTLHGRPHLTKPPAAYWAAALGMTIFGVNEFGARLPAGLAFAGSIFAAAALGRLAGRDDRSGAWCAFVYGSSVLPFVGGSLLTADPFLAAFDAAAIVAAAHALARPEARRRSIRWMGLALGAAFFFKGPAGLVPLLGFAVAWPRRVAPGRGDRAVDVPALAAFAAVGLAWFAWLGTTHPDRLFQLAHAELVQGLFTTSLHRTGPAWMPLAVLAAGSLPWGLWLVPRSRAALARCARDPVARLLAAWCGGGLLVFTLSRSRMPLYVLPLSLALAVAAGLEVARWSRADALRRSVASAVLVAAVASLLLLRAEGDRLPHYRHSRTLARAVAARVPEPGGPVLLLRQAFAPGLAFALGAEPLTVACRPDEQALPHDLDAASLPGFVAGHPRGVIAVAPPGLFAQLPPGLLAVDPRPDARSGLSVAVLEAVPVP